MRLTRKSEKNYLGYDATEELIKQHNASPIIAKLGQLEDIEEELGIDLITLFKALKNGIYIKNHPFLMPLSLLRTHYIDHTTKYHVFVNGIQKEIKFEGYGKTWALTKEELK